MVFLGPFFGGQTAPDILFPCILVPRQTTPHFWPTHSLPHPTERGRGERLPTLLLTSGEKCGLAPPWLDLILQPIDEFALTDGIVQDVIVDSQLPTEILSAGVGGQCLQLIHIVGEIIVSQEEA
jgi:hypothetical protein